MNRRVPLLAILLGVTMATPALAAPPPPAPARITVTYTITGPGKIALSWPSGLRVANTGQMVFSPGSKPTLDHDVRVQFRRIFPATSDQDSYDFRNGPRFKLRKGDDAFPCTRDIANPKDTTHVVVEFKLTDHGKPCLLEAGGRQIKDGPQVVIDSSGGVSTPRGGEK